MGGIPPKATHAEVKESVKNLGALRGCWNLILKGGDSYNHHQGFGFLHLENEEDYLDLISQKIAIRVFGKLLECKQAWTIDEHKARTHQDRLKKLYVSCLKKLTKKQDVYNYFSAFGGVKQVTYAQDSSTGRKLGFCVVEFELAESIEKVLQVRDHFICGKKVKIQDLLLKHELKQNSK